MANLAKTGVVVSDNYNTGGNNGKKFSAYEVTATLSSMGTATNKILASAFGLTKVKGASPATKSDDSVVLVLSPSIDGTYLLAKGIADNTPADYTGDFKFTVWGQP